MKKVLILEDEVNIRSFVVINLKRAGYSVHLPKSVLSSYRSSYVSPVFQSGWIRWKLRTMLSRVIPKYRAPDSSSPT